MSTRAPAGPGGTAPHRRRNIALIVIVVLVVALVGVVVGGEFYARHRVSSCVANALEKELGGTVDVGLGARPLLLTVFNDTVSSIEVSSDDVDLTGPGEAGVRDLSLQSTIHDIHLPEGDAPGTVGSSEAHVQWDTDAIASSLQSLPFGALITGVTANPSAGTMDIEALGGLGTMTLTPAVRGGTVTMDASDVTALGVGLPTGAAQQIIDAITKNLSDYPLGMQPTSVSVTDKGLQVELQGGTAPLAQEGAMEVDCSII